MWLCLLEDNTLQNHCQLRSIIQAAGKAIQSSATKNIQLHDCCCKISPAPKAKAQKGKAE